MTVVPVEPSRVGEAAAALARALDDSASYVESSPHPRDRSRRWFRFRSSTVPGASLVGHSSAMWTDVVARAMLSPLAV